jgi:hypothetical protein
MTQQRRKHVIEKETFVRDAGWPDVNVELRPFNIDQG